MQPSEADERVERARAGDRDAWSELLALYAPRLERMVSLRIERTARRTFEPADVVQDALVAATRRFDEWRTQERYPLHVWLRLLTAQSLTDARRYEQREKRDAGRERELDLEREHVTARDAAEWLLSTHTTPTQAARRGELCDRVAAALEQLDELDREVIVLRQFELLSNEETAAELGIAPAAATKRFTRALQRLRPVLEQLGVDGAGGP